MSPLVTIIVPSLILGCAYALGRRELRLYRTSHKKNDQDVFVYTRGRLSRRMTGVSILVSLALTLCALGFFPPSTPRGATTYIWLFVADLAALFVVPIWDLWETARTARPGKGLRFGDRE